MKKRLFAIESIAIMLISMLMFILTSCKPTTTESSKDFFAMDTFMNISVETTTTSQTTQNSSEILDKAYKKVVEIENNISRTNPQSDIYKLNNSGGEIITVSDITYEILELACKYAKDTNGAFDPTICKVTDLWGIGTENQKVPTDEEIQTALKTVSYENIVMLDDNKVKLLNNAQIDLGGVGKGYATDKIVEIYKQNNALRGIIALAGNIYVYGEKQDKTPWNIGVKDPNNSNDIALSVQTAQTSIVTTGSYERFFEQDGEVYHHIFDSKTGYPTKQDILSVTVVSDNSTLADVYATALFTVGYEKAISIDKDMSEIKVVLINDKNEVYVSDGLDGLDSRQ